MDSKFEPIKNGDIIKWLYIKQNPFGIESIAITGYNDPPQILQFIEQYIDYDKIWDAEMQGKLEDFYQALNWEFPNENLKIASKFFGF